MGNSKRLLISKDACTRGQICVAVKPAIVAAEVLCSCDRQWMVA